ncbi:MAG: hypothetical protein WBA74_20890 [Cyclobacteriaceae bacterium]
MQKNDILYFIPRKPLKFLVKKSVSDLKDQDFLCLRIFQVKKYSARKKTAESSEKKISLKPNPFLGFAGYNMSSIDLRIAKLF